MAASSSRGRSSYVVKPSSSYSSTSSSSSFMNGRMMPRSCSSSATSFYGGSGNGGGGAYGSRSMTPGGNGGDRSRRYSNRSPAGFPAMDEQLTGEPLETTSGDSILVTIRFRPLSDIEYQRGDEIAWYADDGKIVRSEHNPTTAYGFDMVFASDTSTQEVYEVAARPVVKAAMEGVNGTVFAYGVTSSGKTHTMHGDQNSPGIIPLAIKDVFSIIQDTPGREFLLRVSYLEIYNEVINDLLDQLAKIYVLEKMHSEPKAADVEWRDQILEDRCAPDVSMSSSTATKGEPLVVRLKARMQEIKENQLRYTEHGDGNSHVCKICFETPATAMLLPCHHFCCKLTDCLLNLRLKFDERAVCESCSLACSDPICQTRIVDRIFAFT